MAEQTGRITQLMPKGYGFITADNGIDHFFHRSSVRGARAFEQLQEGDRVYFEPAPSDRGPRCAWVWVEAAG